MAYHKLCTRIVLFLLARKAAAIVDIFARVFPSFIFFEISNVLTYRCEKTAAYAVNSDTVVQV